MRRVGRTIFPLIAVLCFVLQVAPGVVADAFDEADEVASVWPFEGDLVAHGDSDSESDAESDAESDVDSESESDYDSDSESDWDSESDTDG